MTAPGTASTEKGSYGQPPIVEGTTALVILVPEAEELVGPFRTRGDPVAPLGMPPHITILFPFYSRADIGQGLLTRLEEHFASFAPFSFELAATGSFPGVLYLRPTPGARFSEIIASTAVLFPDLPPYGGETRESIPHLTVAHAETEAEFEEVRASFEASLADHGPVRGVASSATLMAHSGTSWLELQPFEFHDVRAPSGEARP